MNELKKTENNQQNFLAVIEKVALDPNSNIEKLDKMLDMQERILNKQAELEFNQAMAKAMPEIPSFERTKKGQTNKYATFESINKVVKVIVAKHKLFITFSTEFQSDNFLMVTAKITHEAGHCQEATMRFPFDKSGNKNEIQSVGSAISYGKKYMLLTLLNITTHDEDEDDDGFATSKTIGENEIKRLNDGLDKSGIELGVLCEYMDVERLSEIKVDRFNNAVVYLSEIIKELNTKTGTGK